MSNRIFLPLRLGVAMLLLAGACTPGGDTPPDPATGAGAAPAGATTAAADDFLRCTHTEGGFSVAYPAGWHTNDATVMPACSLFDPQPVTVPPASEIPEDIAISLSVQPVDMERIAGGDAGARVLESHDRQVAGRRALAQLTESTGDGLHDRGLRAWRYLVEWGDGRTLIAVSHDAGEPAFEVKRRELDRMMETLRREE